MLSQRYRYSLIKECSGLGINGVGLVNWGSLRYAGLIHDANAEFDWLEEV